MPTWTGILDNSGSPVIKISIYGVLDTMAQEFDAIVDTGFTGFLSMPMVDAFPLGLVLAGTTTTVLADGSLSNKLVALGTAAVGSEQQRGSILTQHGKWSERYSQRDGVLESISKDPNCDRWGRGIN